MRKRSVGINVRVSVTEKRKMTLMAKRCGLSLSEYLSRMAGKLRKKNTLGSAVALSEWVKLIRSFIKVYYGRNEVRSV